MNAPLPTVECRRCHRPISWVTTAAGRRFPVDPEPNRAGTVIVRIEDGTARATVLAADKPRPPGVAFVTHFATCGQRVPKEPKPLPAPNPQLPLFTEPERNEDD